MNELSDFTKERLRLSIKRGGMGFKFLWDVRHAEWIGGFIQGTSTLLDATDQQGNRRNGRAHLPTIVNMLGEEALDTGNLSHWETLLSRAACPIANALRDTHGAFLEKAQKMGNLSDAPSFNNMTLAQPMTNIGFDKEGKRPASTTNAISQEFDEARAAHLRSVAKEEEHSTNSTLQESLSFLHCNRYFTLPLKALPDRRGSCPDILFPEILHRSSASQVHVVRTLKDNGLGRGDMNYPLISSVTQWQVLDISLVEISEKHTLPFKFVFWGWPNKRD